MVEVYHATVRRWVSWKRVRVCVAVHGWVPCLLGWDGNSCREETLSPSFFSVPNLFAARARARSVSTSRSRGSALVTSESSRFRAAVATSSTARLNAASFAFEGLLKPESFLTNWSEASRISSSVAGGSKLNRVLMFRHITFSFPDLFLSMIRKAEMVLKNSASTTRHFDWYRWCWQNAFRTAHSGRIAERVCA